MKTTIYRKTLTPVVCLVVMAGLAGCGDPISTTMSSSFNYLYSQIDQSINQPIMPDGTYTLADTNVKPLPSVVYYPDSHEFHLLIQDGSSSNEVILPVAQTSIVTTDGARVVKANHDHYTIYLHKDDQISEVTTTSSGDGFTKGVIVGVLLHSLLK